MVTYLGDDLSEKNRGELYVGRPKSEAREREGCSHPSARIDSPAMRKTLTTVFTRGGNQIEVLYECRNCGMNLEYGASTCDECGSSDVVVYDFSDVD